jgi:peptidoglycan/xylan/chitin deacetylase (PgdA/CDA1 family)
MPGARYILRFDDICPTMNWAVWNQVERLLTAHSIRPVLAVVPDNRDPHLQVSAAEPRFWEKVREWQRSRGWTIALHGYQHKYVTRNPGMLGRNAYSEFAGLTEQEQERKIAGGLAIFKRENVTADAWVAPAHSFDETTLRVLSKHGITRISDGYALRPFRDSANRVWAPQQIGRFVDMPAGVMTVCMHCNGWTKADLREFAANLDRFEGRFTDFETAVREGEQRGESWADAAFFHSFRAVRVLRSLV